MVLKVVGSTPISRPIIIYIGVSPSGKALDFDSSIRRFESCHPSQKRNSLSSDSVGKKFNMVH